MTTTGNHRRGRPARLLALAITLVSTSCARHDGPLADREKLVRATLALLASDGRPACLDSATEDNSLAVFRQMARAPRPARAQLHWYPPRPLRPADPEQTVRLASIDQPSPVLAIPGARIDPLPPMTQFMLWNAAGNLAARRHVEDGGLRIRKAMVPAGITARWWPINRLRHDCEPRYVVSDPVFDRSIGFVTMRAGHTGTLYALRPDGAGGWSVVAEWSRWLY